MNLSPLHRYFGLYGALWKNSVVREMGIKSNFLLWIVVELLWFSLHIAFIAVIYMHTGQIVDLSLWQVVLFSCAAHFIPRVFHAVFLSNCIQLSDHVRTGKLEFILLLLVNSLFLVSLRVVDRGGFINATSALV